MFYIEFGGIGLWYGSGEYSVVFIVEFVRRVFFGVVFCYFGGDRVCGGCILFFFIDKFSSIGVVFIILFIWRYKDDYLLKIDCNKYCILIFNIIYILENWGFLEFCYGK